MKTTQIAIKSGISGAQSARGLGVLIDVFRGSSTIVALFAGEVEHVIPVVSLNEAWKLKRRNPKYFLVGETKGKTPKGFNCGNSPFEVSLLNLRGKDIVFRSSAASKGIHEAYSKAKISELLIGGFVNANSIVASIKEKMPKEITLIAIGTFGFGGWRRAAEDEYCARFLKKLLVRKEADFSKMKSKILEEDGAARLIKLGQAEDLKMCLNLDLFNGIIPSLKKSESRIHISVQRE